VCLFFEFFFLIYKFSELVTYHFFFAQGNTDLHPVANTVNQEVDFDDTISLSDLGNDSVSMLH